MSIMREAPGGGVSSRVRAAALIGTTTRPAAFTSSSAVYLQPLAARSNESEHNGRSAESRDADDKRFPLLRRFWSAVWPYTTPNAQPQRHDDDGFGKPRSDHALSPLLHTGRSGRRWLVGMLFVFLLYWFAGRRSDSAGEKTTPTAVSQGIPRRIKQWDLPGARPSLPPMVEKRKVSDHPIHDGLLHVNLNNTVHPIYQLIRDARRRWDAKVARQSTTLKQAIAEYRKRYKMNPPTGFDKWWEFVVEHDIPLPDEYDQIYTDLLPFRALSPRDLQTKLDRASQMPDTYVLKVRKGSIRTSVTFSTSEVHGADNRMSAQAELLQPVAKWLGDLSAVYSVHDTAQVVLSHEHRQELLEHLADDEYFDEDEEIDLTLRGWASTCSYSSPLRLGRENPQSTPSIDKSFIASHRALMNICDRPDLVPIHGVLAGHDPRVTDLIPLFSLSKTTMHADILGVPVEQWTDKIPTVSWEDKSEETLLWRGSNTGTHYSEEFPWRDSHRTRLVQLANALGGKAGQAQLEVLPAWKGPNSPSDAKKAPALDKGIIRMARRRANSDWMDIKFAGKPIQCQPDECEMLRDEYPFSAYMSPEASWKYKYIIDVDGNAWSARFQRLISSGSLIFKSTIMPEWWTDRIEPWVHYVPIQVDYSDLYDALAFFRGDAEHPEKLPGEPLLAQRIAAEGQAWARTHWRKEDMTAYVFRLYLEWARLVSPQRKKMDLVYDESMERIRT